ncbi:ptaL [Symbiodinium microadriaticum]|nr:ptaL [Symbiodinium microadriaticum]CAE7948755.1 ptaL [Symbiodinium sp. KB8]
MAKSFDVAVVGAGLSAFHAVEVLAKSKKSVAYIHGFTFQEWAMAAAVFLNSPEEHVKWTSGDPEKWMVKKWTNVEYFLSPAETVNCDQKEITLMHKGPDAGKVINYKVLIVASGQNSPLLTPTAGMSLSERISEVRACGEALKQAKTVVFNGAGLVGLEMCGDFRARNGYGARVVLLTRSGKVLDSDFGDKAEKPDPKMVAKVTDILTNRFKIEIKEGAASGPESEQASLSPGTLKLDSGENLSFDVYIPCFSMGANTGFLKSSNSNFLGPRGTMLVNECMQSSAHPEVLGVNVTNKKLAGHPVTIVVSAAATHCAKQALEILDGKPAKAFVPPKESIHPMNVKMGHGPGGYMVWSGLPGPAHVCCCLPCGGGYPFCPPPCCWCCLPGCSGACGTCGSPPEGEGPAVFMPALLAKFTGMHGFKGLGDYGSDVPQQKTMA